MPARIDDSHYAFKRRSAIGPGPKHRPKIHEHHVWHCSRPLKPTRGKYTQICRNVETGQKHTVTVSKVKKAKYNKLYKRFAKKHRQAAAARPARRTYKCRRSRWARCK